MSLASTHFDPRRFERQFAASDLTRYGLIALVAAGYVAAAIGPFAGSPWPVCLLGAGLIGWLIANALSGRTARLALQSAQLAAAEGPLDQLEDVLGRGLASFTLYRSVRVMLYHQLAVLRHRQRRYHQTVRICCALLGRPGRGMGQPMQRRVRLLLADACLHRRDAAGAHAAITPLYAQRLELNDALQLLDLQTRYEWICVQTDRMLHALQHKVGMAEIMPPEPAARLHRLLGAAAHKHHRPKTAAWLQERAALLHAEDTPGLVTGASND